MATAKSIAMKKILFLCGRNKWRSPTAEALFAGHPGIECASAGLSRDADTPVSVNLVQWADVIFVMEKAHKTKLFNSVQGSACRQARRLPRYRRQLPVHGPGAGRAAESESHAASSAGAEPSGPVAFCSSAQENRDLLLPSREQQQRPEHITNEYRARLRDKIHMFFVVPESYESRPTRCMNGWGNAFLTIRPTARPCLAAPARRRIRISAAAAARPTC